MKKPKIYKTTSENEQEKEIERANEELKKKNRRKVTTKEFFELLLAGYIGMLPFFLILILILLVAMWLLT